MKKNSILGRRMNPALANMSQMQRDNLLIRASQKANLLISLMVLHDKFEFGEEKLTEYIEEFRKQLEAYNDGYIEKASDFEDVLRDECGIEVKL